MEFKLIYSLLLDIKFKTVLLPGTSHFVFAVLGVEAAEAREYRRSRFLLSFDILR